MSAQIGQDRTARHQAASVQSGQGWEGGLKFPATARLQQLIQSLLEASGLTRGRESSEARELWAAAEHEAPRMHSHFDEQWTRARIAPGPVLTDGIGHPYRPAASQLRARSRSQSHAPGSYPRANVPSTENPASATQAAVLQERARIARELHDSVSQTLYAITLGASRARSLLHQNG